MKYWKNIARVALDIGAIRINPEEPFTWASGYRMPVYNDNRLFLGEHKHRFLIAESMQEVIESRHIPVDCIAGTATAGIPHATTLANMMELPLVYVRSTSKGHGLQNQVEGVLEPGQEVVLIEDLVSTGGSALKAVEALRAAGARVAHCLCIFSYGFESATTAFKSMDCQLHTLLTFPNLVAFAEETGRINEAQKTLLDAWYEAPFEWAAKQGF
ncbi:orotate phosphoribosyltransferase [Nitrospina gracilis]|uniref:orotate phosphoribosyltransferase n=1 Tax=Nitrospina gracilis TaxID=35801 RepID=UPI001F01C682|nr:orotate phosphoribosyltransferase [Nitrospina gracilis]MCF8720948.1 orotate phosphoribosyltransferase [Nitrospina gracilis Nb-211]